MATAPNSRTGRRPTHKELVESEPRCIYCASRPDSLEHMPPIWIFEKRERPKGLEFATCKTCNNGTRGVDLAVGFLSRLRMFNGDLEDPLFLEARAKVGTLDQLMPGLREELFDNSPYEDVRLERDGVLQDAVRIEAKGPIVANALVTFGAKLGMALYREHTGHALPLDGAVYVQPFLNGGLSQENADRIVSILPGRKTLQQGRREVSKQFEYAFNSDDRSIVMALASFHRNLHFMVFAAAEPSFYHKTVSPQFVSRVAPGELLRDRHLTTFDPRYVLPGLPGSAS